MAKGCLDKLTGNVVVNCSAENLGVAGLYLMYPEDVTLTFGDNNRSILSIAFATGAKSYFIEGYKQNIQITTALRSLDVSARLDVSIMFKVPGGSHYFSSKFFSGKFYVLEIPNNPGSSFNVWGINCPLECSNWEYDSNANGRLATVTLSAPEGSAGNHRCYCAAAIKDSIIAKSV